MPVRSAIGEPVVGARVGVALDLYGLGRGVPDDAGVGRRVHDGAYRLAALDGVAGGDRDPEGHAAEPVLAVGEHARLAEALQIGVGELVLHDRRDREAAAGDDFREVAVEGHVELDAGCDVVGGRTGPDARECCRRVGGWVAAKVPPMMTAKAASILRRLITAPTRGPGTALCGLGTGSRRPRCQASFPLVVNHPWQ